MDDIGFSRFCQVCETVRNSTGKLDKIRVLADYLRALDEKELSLAAVWLTGRPFAQRDPHPLNLGGAVIYRALLVASGLSDTELREISRRHNDSGKTTEEAMRAQAGNLRVNDYRPGQDHRSTARRKRAGPQNGDPGPGFGGNACCQPPVISCEF